MLRMKCPIYGRELKKMVEKSDVKGFEVPTEFYRCESCEEELMTEVQFRKGMDKIIELKAEVLVSSVEGDYIKLQKELDLALVILLTLLCIQTFLFKLS